MCVHVHHTEHKFILSHHRRLKISAPPRNGSIVSEEATLKSVLERENRSEISVDQPQTSTEPADPPASSFDSVADAGGESQLCLFVVC